MLLWIFFIWTSILQLVDISADGYLSLMMDSGDIREDIRLPPEGDLRTEIEEKFGNGDDLLVSYIEVFFPH